MVLTDKQIRKLCDGYNGNLISPFNENSLQSESYDLSIGKEISVLKKEVRCIDIEKEKDLENIYEINYMQSSGYILSPKEYVLVELKEKITLPDNITAHIRPRTKFTRLGLIVSAQHCNSTYSGVLRLGLFNATDYAIKIKPNVKIAQIVFEELKEIPSENKLYKNKKDASYQNEKDFRGPKFSNEFYESVEKTVNRIIGTEE